MADPAQSGNQGANNQSGQGIDWSTWGPFAANVFSSIMGYQGSRMSSGQRADQRWMNDFAWKQALRQEEFSKDYQLNYLQHRARDAEKAGLHPLAALGVNTGSGPTAAAFVGADSNSRPNSYELMSNLGQNVSRAFLAQRSSDERALAQATLGKINAETDYTRAMELEARTRTQNMQLPPPMPQMSQGQKYQLVKNAMDRYEWILSPEASQGIMSDPIRMWSNSIENAIAGPETYPFWRSVGRGAKRAFNPYNALRRGD